MMSSQLQNKFQKYIISFSASAAQITSIIIIFFGVMGLVNSLQTLSKLSDNSQKLPFFFSAFSNFLLLFVIAMTLLGYSFVVKSLKNKEII